MLRRAGESHKSDTAFPHAVSHDAHACTGTGVGSSGMTHTNGGPKDLGSWEAQLTAKEEALKKRESVVAAAEGRLGVRACTAYLQ